MDMLEQLCQNQPLNRIKSGGIIDDKEEDRIRGTTLMYEDVYLLDLNAPNILSLTIKGESRDVIPSYPLLFLLGRFSTIWKPEVSSFRRTLNTLWMMVLKVTSWKNLRSLSLSNVNLNEGMIQNIFSGSPVLETLEFEECGGFKQLDITSKSVKNFVFSGGSTLMYEDVYPLDLNAPNILSLTIKGGSLLQMIWLIDVSSLVEANLDNDDDVWITEYAEEDMLQLLVQRLSHVKHLKLGIMLLEVLYRLEAEGFIVPSNIEQAVDDGPKGDEVN
nr:hypothetical protein [Tanacetum cinerariifolium]